MTTTTAIDATNALAALLADINDPDQPYVSSLNIRPDDQRVSIFTGQDRKSAARWAERFGFTEPVRQGKPRELSTGILIRDWVSSGQWHGWYVEVCAFVQGGRS